MLPGAHAKTARFASNQAVVAVQLASPMRSRQKSFLDGCGHSAGELREHERNAGADVGHGGDDDDADEGGDQAVLDGRCARLALHELVQGLHGVLSQLCYDCFTQWRCYAVSASYLSMPC